MGDLLTTASELLGRRRLLTAWLPVLVFLVALGALAAWGMGWSQALQAWNELPVQASVLIGLALLVVSAGLAQTLIGLRLPLIRLHEGYWSGSVPFGAALECRYRAHHADVHAAHQRRQRTEAGFVWPDDYPRGGARVLPTRLGNILRAAEEHAYLRYGIDSVTTWPRLYPTLPDTFREAFGSAAAGLDLMIIVSVLGVLFAVLGGLLSAVLLPWYAVPPAIWGGLLVALLAHRGAVHSARGYALLVRAAFDVHRWKLLDEMGLRRPADYDSERGQWVQLRKLWLEMGPDSLKAHLLRYPLEPAADPDPLAANADDPPLPGSPPHPTGTVESTPLVKQEDGSPHGTQESAPSGPSPRRVVTVLVLGRGTTPRPAADLARLGVVAGGLAALLAAGIHAASPAQVTAKAALPAFHQLTAADLDGTAHRPEAAGLTGRYTLRSVPAGAEISPSSLGPNLPPASLAGRVATVVSVQPGNATAVRRGDRVMLLAAFRNAPIVVDDALVLDLLPSRRLVVALTRADLTRLAGSTGALQIARALG